MPTKRQWVILALAFVCFVTILGARKKTREYDGNKIGPQFSEATVNSSGGADVTVTLPQDCVYFAVQSRGGLGFRFAIAAGDIASGNYKTVRGGSEYFQDDIDPGRGTVYTIYLRGDTGASDTIEVETWIGK